ALVLDPDSRAARDGLEMLRLKQMLAGRGPRLRAAGPRRLGAYAVEQGFLTVDQLDEALWEQRQRRRRGDLVLLGDILLQRGWLTPHPRARVLVSQQEAQGAASRTRPRFLGEYLLADATITSLQLEAALEEQARMRLAGHQLPLGIILVRSGAISLETLK